LAGRDDEHDANIGETRLCPNRDSTRAPPDLVKALPFQLCNTLYTVSTQHQYSDIMYVIGYTVAT